MKNKKYKIDLMPQVKNVKNTIKTAAVSASFLALAIPTLAHSFTIEFFSTHSQMPKIIDLSLDSIDKTTGDFSGEAVSSDNPHDIWEVTGTIVGDKVELELQNLNLASRIVASGEIKNDVIVGKAATEEGELLEWEATDALIAKANA